MKVLVKTKLKLIEKREFIANLASAIVQAKGDKSAYQNASIPYRPNDWDNSFWTIDAGNDWKIKFYEQDDNVFEVIHRYQVNDKNNTEFSEVNDAVKSLAGFLAYRLNGKVIVE